MYTHSYSFFNNTNSSANIEWNETLKPVEPRSFTHPTGPRVPLPKSILGTFLLLFTSDLIQYIVDQTNLYAQQCMGPDKYSTWTNVTADEFTAFPGFMVLMGLVQLPAMYFITIKLPTKYHATGFLI